MMFWLVNEKRPWFRGRSYGFGAGLPMAWQGWALLALHVALIFGVTLLLRASPVALVAAVIAVALAPMPIYSARTKGGWRWRWGDSK